MQTGMQADRSDVRTLLEDLCARNASAELQYNPTSDQIRSARVRLLALDKGVVYTDQPHMLDDQPSLREGQKLSVYVLHKQNRLAFDTQVLRCRGLLRLNPRQRVVAMSLRAPTEIHNQQRRRDFRVSMVSHATECDLVEESAQHPFACDLSSRVHHTAITDLSARGLSVVIPKESARKWKVGKRLIVRFLVLEGEQEYDEHVVLAEIRHMRRIAGQDTVRLGMALHPLPGVAWQKQMRDLNAVVTNEQRRRLRRRR